ncbi:MAG: lipid-binding SYLF domain-containing protein [Nitrospinae bacterium]|nr:lipid-binding SYLF domain-containing protein [Nitrospinota bacterium]
MKRIVLLVLFLSSWIPTACADEDVRQKLLRDSISVMEEMVNAPDQEIPMDLISQAKAIIIFPTMVKAGFFVGGRYGKGVATMRSRKTGKFGPPAFITQAGASFGFQFGVEAVDLILLVMTQRGVEGLLKNQFTLGADAAVSVGPVGRHAEAAVDVMMQGEIYSYSRSKGAFVGISLKGTVITGDEDANHLYYNQALKSKAILLGGKVRKLPQTGERFIKAINLLVQVKEKAGKK